MPLKHLEHDGGEDFVDEPTKYGEFLSSKKEQEVKEVEAKGRLIKEIQDNYLHIDNPALWTGEI